jgi:HD-like signal output (HDOD) protein
MDTMTMTMTRERENVVRDIRDFLVAAESLPSPKGTALQLMAVARDPRAEVSDAVKVVKSDPALAGFVLRAANSARFGGLVKAVDLQRAVIRLGMNMIRVYAISLSVMAEKPRQRCPEFDYERFWTRSLLAGLVAARIAAQKDFPAEETFSLGLLGHIGRLAFATSVPAEYGRVLSQVASGATTLEAGERAQFGFDHHELSAVLLVDWGLPAKLADVVYWQYDPEEGGFAPESREHQMAGALQLAGSVAELSFRDHLDPAAVAAAYLRAALLDLGPAQVRQITADALGELGNWSAFTKIAVPTRPLSPADWPDA